MRKTFNTSSNLKEKIIARGVANLKEFGYPNVDEKNILTDYIYSSFFKTMLKENLGADPTVDVILNELLKEIAYQHKLCQKVNPSLVPFDANEKKSKKKRKV